MRTAYRGRVRLRFLLQPGWLALTLVVLAFAAACYTLLAPWQFSRDTERSVQNDALRTSFSAEPQSLDTVLPQGQAPDKNSQWTKVSITGNYLSSNDVVARLRTIQGEPAFEVLTPFRATDGRVVLIDRGYLRPDDQTRVPTYEVAPDETVTIVGRLRIDEQDGKNRQAFADESTDGKLQSYVINSQVVSAATNTSIEPGYIQLEADQPGILSALPLPTLDSGPFFSYALQWIAFGTMALLGWLYFTAREIQPGGTLHKTPAQSKVKSPKRKSIAQLLAEDD